MGGPGGVGLTSASVAPSRYGCCTVVKATGLCKTSFVQEMIINRGFHHVDLILNLEVEFCK